MSDDFKNLIEDIEAEAKTESSEAELREMRREFSIANQQLTLRMSAPAEPFGVKAGFVDPIAGYAAAVSDQASPARSTVSGHIQESHEGSDFRAEYERLRTCEEFPRIVLRRRAALGLSQAGLAARMGVAIATVSLIEGGQHGTDAQTLKKLADAFSVRAVFGFEAGTAEKPERELVTL